MTSIVNNPKFPLGILNGLIIHRTCPTPHPADPSIMEDYQVTLGAAKCKRCGWTVPYPVFREACQEMIYEAKKNHPELDKFETLWTPGSPRNIK